jgi:hypothetical protein
MISKIIKNYKNIQVEFELEYTGPETIQYVIIDDRCEPLPLNSLDQNFLTLSLPEDFEKMCLFNGSYKILNMVPDTVEFSNGKICDLKLNNINKYLSIENNELVVRDNNFTDIETFLRGLESYKTQTIEKLSNTTDVILIEKLETLLSEIDFVIDSTENEPDFQYWFYSFI